MVKEYCECCGSTEKLEERDAERIDKKIFKITICSKCLIDYNRGRF